MQRCKVGALGVLLLLVSGCALDPSEPGDPSTSSDKYAGDSPSTTDAPQLSDGKVGAQADRIRNGAAVLGEGDPLGGQEGATDSSGKPQPGLVRGETNSDSGKPQPVPWKPGSQVTSTSSNK